MSNSAAGPGGPRHPSAFHDARYIRPHVVSRLRTFLASGGSYHRDVVPAIAAAMLAESATP
jgi:hypothetical protein